MFRAVSRSPRETLHEIYLTSHRDNLMSHIGNRGLGRDTGKKMTRHVIRILVSDWKI